MTSSSRRHDTLRLWQHDARAAGEPLGEHIARRLVADASLLPAVARAAGLEALAPASLVAATDFAHLPLSDAVRHRVLPVHVDGMRYVVLEDPFDLAVRSWCVAHRAASRMRAAMTMPGVVMRTLEDAERHERVLDTTGVGDDAGGTARRVTEISRTSIDGQSDAVVRLVDAALLDALRARASDIHVETAADGLAIRYRIDGVLHLAGRWPGQDDAGQAISRLKVLAGLDIGERRVPQDGRFRARIEGGDVDFRVSVMPSIHGEDAVLRAGLQADLKPFHPSIIVARASEPPQGKFLKFLRENADAEFCLLHVQGFAMFSVIEKSSGRWIGQTGPWKPEGWPGNEVGWAFHPSSWGNGYATEATVAAVDWAFANLDWSEMIHCIAPANHASQALAQRIGSYKRGPGRLPPPFEDAPVEIWTQTREAWLARRSEARA